MPKHVHLRHVIPVLLLWASLAGIARSQTVLAQGDVVVASTSGVFAFHPLQAAVKLAPGPLIEPAIEWAPDSDRLYLVSGNQLLEVTVQSFSAGGATVQPLVSFPTGSRVTDVDVDHTTGDVWVLDRTLGLAHRFAAPVLPGAQPDATLQLAQDPRALCVDSVNYPTSVVYATTGGLMRQTTDGLPTVESNTKVTSDAGVDTTWQIPQHGTFVVDHDVHKIWFCPYQKPDTLVTVQHGFGVFIPHPTDVEWLPGTPVALVTGGDGISPAAFPFLQTDGSGVHVVLIRPGGGQLIGPPLFELYSEPDGFSGLTGSQPDLAVVADGAFAGPYGDPSPALTGESPVLLHDGIPFLGNAAFGVEVKGGPPGRPVFVGIGFAPAQLMYTTGTALVDARVWLPAGVTGPLGDLVLPVPVPNDSALTSADVYGQAVVFGSLGEPAFTNGIKVRFR